VLCDFGLSGYLKAYLAGRTYGDDLTIQHEVNNILAAIDPDVFVRVFAE
jgi:hypothetical protein